MVRKISQMTFDCRRRSVRVGSVLSGWSSRALKGAVI